MASQSDKFERLTSVYPGMCVTGGGRVSLQSVKPDAYAEIPSGQLGAERAEF